MVMQFYRLSKEARRSLQMEDDYHLVSFNSGGKATKCLHLIKSMMKLGKNVVWGSEEEEGYNSLVRTSIYNKGQALKDNNYVEHGVFVSGQTEYVLHELYSGRIQ